MIVTRASCIRNIGRSEDVSMNMCVRCGEGEAPEPLGFCTSCALQVRVELADGFKRLRGYLAAWAAFDEWLSGRGEGTAAA
jgi:hypothetical protein